MSQQSTGPWLVERTYPTAEGARHNIAAAARFLSIKASTFWSRQRHGWPILYGGKLTPREMKFSDGRRGHWEDTFLEADLVSLRGKPLPQDGRYATRGGTRLDRGVAGRELGVCYHTLKHMEDRDEIAPEETRCPITGATKKTYSVADVEKIKARRARPRHVHRKVDGAWYMPRAEALQRLGLSHNACPDPGTSCLHVRGLTIRTVPVRAPRGGPETWFRVGDVTRARLALRECRKGIYRIARVAYVTLSRARAHYRVYGRTLARLVDAGLVATAPCPGERGKKRAPLVYRAADLVAYKQSPRPKFDGVYGTAEAPRWNLRRAARQSRLARSFLTKQIKASPYLPEGRLPSVLMSPPAERGRSHQEHTVAPADLVRLKAGIREALKSGRLGGNWGGAAEIARRYGVKGTDRLIALGVALKAWREGDRLPAQRVWRAWSERRRRRVWVYDLDALARLLADEGGLQNEATAGPATVPSAEKNNGRGRGAGAERGADAAGLNKLASHPVDVTNGDELAEKTAQALEPRIRELKEALLAKLNEFITSLAAPAEVSEGAPATGPTPSRLAAVNEPFVPSALGRRIRAPSKGAP